MQGSSRPDRTLLDAAALCRHLLGEGSVHAFLAEHRSALFPDELFADLFPTNRGRPSVPSDVIATVMVLQALEGLSDRQAVRRLETDIAWKAAAGLALTDEAFHPTVLVLWRNKLRASDRPQRIFDAVRAVIAGSGVIAGRTRRALDSTVLDDAVQLVWAVEDLGLKLSAEQADAVALLALVAGQDVEPADGPGRWRIAQRTAPDRVVSTNDPESRHTHKTDHAYRDGFKAHVAAEPETGLVTDCDLTPGNTSDADAAPGLIDDEPEGTVVLGDSAYGAGEFRDHLERSAKTAVIKPPPLRPAVPGGFDLDDFEIDAEAATMTCPAGITVVLTAKGRATFGAHCRACPLRSLCTTARGGRKILLHPHHRHLAAARAQARTEEFELVYRRWRPMVERTLAWLTRGTNRKLRYRGVERNQLWWAHRCAAVNLQRLITLGLIRRNDDGWAIA